VEKTSIHWLFDIEIDPADSDHAVFTTGYGGWETHDLTAMDHGRPTHWSALAVGIEETVALQLDSASAGAHLISAIGDYGGFVHENLDRPSPEGSTSPPRFGNTTGVASAALDPNVVVRVGVSAEHKPGENISYSAGSARGATFMETGWPEVVRLVWNLMMSPGAALLIEIHPCPILTLFRS
jgi:hypothetical protein